MDIGTHPPAQVEVSLVPVVGGAANLFRVTRKSKLKLYRCRDCKHNYNLYTNTVLQQHYLAPQQVVLLLRCILKGETTRELAAELKLNYLAVLTVRRASRLEHQHRRASPFGVDGTLGDDSHFQRRDGLGEFGRIYFADFDQTRARERTVIVQIIGE
jgi:hypothetical protein